VSNHLDIPRFWALYSSGTSYFLEGALYVYIGFCDPSTSLGESVHSSGSKGVVLVGSSAPSVGDAGSGSLGNSILTGFGLLLMTVALGTVACSTLSSLEKPPFSI